MADLTFVQLLAQITGRLNRDDLATVARDHFADRVNYYTKEFFYSAEVVDESITTTAGTRYYALPLRWAQVVDLRVKNGVWIPMDRKSNVEMNDSDVLVNALQALPNIWCIFGGQLRIWPCGANYNLQVTMDQAPAAPVADGDITFWSTDAQTLMIEATIESICDNYLNDPVRAGKARTKKMEEEASLHSKSIRAKGGINFVGYL